MRALVAGGAGFIGSHVSEDLLAGGWELVVVDNFVTGNRKNLATIEGRSGFEFIECDVLDTPDLEVDAVFHLASPASPLHYDRHRIDTMLANSAGTRRLLEIAARNRARFVFASTSEVYGDPAEHPQRESYWGNVNPNGPRSCYDESKRFGEALTLAYERECGVNATIVRIFNTYGPRMDVNDGRVIPTFFRQALQREPLSIFGDGSQTRSLCYVSDLVRGLLAVAADGGSRGEVFNIGNPEEVTMLDLARRINVPDGQRCGHNLPLTARRRPDEAPAGHQPHCGAIWMGASFATAGRSSPYGALLRTRRLVG